jgi:hypothetical protein
VEIRGEPALEILRAALDPDTGNQNGHKMRLGPRGLRDSYCSGSYELVVRTQNHRTLPLDCSRPNCLYLYEMGQRSKTGRVPRALFAAPAERPFWDERTNSGLTSRLLVPRRSMVTVTELGLIYHRTSVLVFPRDTLRKVCPVYINISYLPITRLPDRHLHVAR